VIFSDSSLLIIQPHSSHKTVIFPQSFRIHKGSNS